MHLFSSTINIEVLLEHFEMELEALTWGVQIPFVGSGARVCVLKQDVRLAAKAFTQEFLAFHYMNAMIYWKWHLKWQTNL